MIRMIDLNSDIIKLGPLTLLTVDEGYAAITQDNGKQVILPGGHVHLLTHRNWKFEKFVSQKIETMDLQNIVTPSADNVLMEVDSTVAWQIVDVQRAATAAIATMSVDGGPISQDTERLRYDILKQAEASLSMFIGTVNYSSTTSHSAALHDASGDTPRVVAEPATQEEIAKTIDDTLFAGPGMLSAIAHANEFTMNYGIKILSINIISAKPKDEALTRSLALGAVAAAEAQQAETAAYGKARALTVEAEGAASARIIEAKAGAEADRIAADGALKAAELLQQSPIAAELAKIERTGTALGNSSKFFFGNGLMPGDVGNLLGANIAGAPEPAPKR